MAVELRPRRPTGDDLLSTTGGRRSPLLRALDHNDLGRLAAAGRLVWSGARDPIRSSQLPDDTMHVVLEGAALERWWLAGQDESFLHPVGPGHVVGLVEALGQSRHASEVRAVGRTLTLRIPGSTLHSLAVGSPQLASALLAQAVSVLANAEADVAVMRSSDVRTRVVRRILDLVEGWGAPARGGMDVQLPLAQGELADWAGASRESTVKVLQWLRERGVVATSRRHIEVLDVAALEAIMR